MSDAIVLSEVRASHHVITLNRPERLNSFNVQQHKELKLALDAAEADTSCRAVILTGAGRGFCAGQDLQDRTPSAKALAGADASDALGLYYNPLIRRLASFPVPVICAVNGVAAGAGVSIALACDFVVAATSAKFLQAFAKIGLVPDAGSTWTLPRLVGSARARALTMLAEPIDAATAESWGMIYKVVDDAALMTTAAALAEKLAHSSTSAILAIRDALAAAEANSLTDQLDLERATQARLVQTHDAQEGIRAFIEKRAPKFSGRA